MKKYKSLVYLVIFIAILIVGAYTSQNGLNLNNQASENIQGTQVSSYPKDPNVVYPNPNLTPGAVLDVTSSQVCVSGYSSTVRNVTTTTKKEVYEEYGVTYPQPTGDYEVDHFIPLELGGSNDITNLFLEPANPKPGFHEKDVVENYLHDQVCNHGMDLKTAQDEIRTDWYAVYLSIPDHKDFDYYSD